MGNGDTGPGARKFREAYAAGANPDAAAIVREHPGEALALANAVIEAAAHKSSEGRTRMWTARAEVLRRAGEDMTLGGRAGRTASRRASVSARSARNTPARALS